jgi:CheY-like chemotaxis protein
MLSKLPFELKMPIMDGYTATSTLREADPAAQCARICLYVDAT